MTKYRWIIFVAAVVVLFGGLVAYNKIQSASLPKSEGSSNRVGPENAKVTVTEYVDFQCEACYAYYPTVLALKEKYKDTVAFEIKNFPIATAHKYARMAAAYAESASRQGKFFEMHDKIFEGQKQWEVAADPQTFFDQYAQEIGLDMEKLKADVLSQDVTAVINADLAEAKEAGVNSTPTFFINGERLDQPENSVEAFSAIIDAALKAE